MIKIDKVVIVEGKYDKIRLETVIDAPILTTNGFSIFNNKQLQSFIRKAADERGIIIMTDSDNAGFMIRSKICSFVPKEKITHVYLPEISGKEKRKATASKQGLLGVEGINNEIIIEALKKAGIDEDGFCETKQNNISQITKTDLYELGLCGKENSAALRKALQKKLDLPSAMSANALLCALNIFMDKEKLKEMCEQL